MRNVTPRIPRSRSPRAAKLAPPNTREVHFVWRGSVMLARGPMKDRKADIVARSLAQRLGLGANAMTLWPEALYEMGDIFRAQWHDDTRGHDEHLLIFGPRSAHGDVAYADPKSRQAAMRRDLRDAKAALAEMKAAR